MKKHKKGKMTLDTLAGMVARGFQEAAKDLSGFRIEVNERFGEVNKRLDRIEDRLLADHRHRIEMLEDDMKRIKEAVHI